MKPVFNSLLQLFQQFFVDLLKIWKVVEELFYICWAIAGPALGSFWLDEVWKILKLIFPSIIN